jgi:hypothetical protein
MKIDFDSFEIIDILKKDIQRQICHRKHLLKPLKMIFTCFLRCKCAKNTQNLSLLSNWIVIR